MGIPAAAVFRVFLACALVALAACAPPAATAPVGIAVPAAGAAAPAVAEVRQAVAEVLVPALVDAREIVQEALPPPGPHEHGVSPAAVALIVGFEIVSPAYYQARLQRPIWPGGASGVTWGVGYDGGHQTRQRIARDWAMHPAVLRLQDVAGVIAARAKPLAASMRDIVTPLPMAQEVFASATLPAYEALAARTFRDGYAQLPPNARGSLVATVQNRGASMRGDSRREMRVLRDDCVPRGDLDCMAGQFVSMCRVWAGTDVEAGLCRRYRATAQLAVQA